MKKFLPHRRGARRHARHPGRRVGGRGALRGVGSREHRHQNGHVHGHPARQRVQPVGRASGRTTSRSRSTRRTTRSPASAEVSGDDFNGTYDVQVPHTGDDLTVTGSFNAAGTSSRSRRPVPMSSSYNLVGAHDRRHGPDGSDHHRHADRGRLDPDHGRAGRVQGVGSGHHYRPRRPPPALSP